MTNKTFYVYEHRHKDNGCIFYIGKGTAHSRGDYIRAFDFWRRKKSWFSSVKKHGVVASVVAEFFTEHDALAFEAELIATYGRRDLGKGPLINHTDGGKGASGYKMHPDVITKLSQRNRGRIVSAETRRKISEANSGQRHWKYGAKESEETRAKKAASMRGKNTTGKRVVDKKTGRLFASVLDAARHLNIPGRTLHNYLTGERRNRTTLEFA